MPIIPLTNLDRLLSKEMQNKNRFSLVFPSFPEVNVFVKNVAISGASLEASSVAGAKFYEGFTEAGEVTMEFYSSDNFEVYDYFRTWFEKYVFNSKTLRFRVIPKEWVALKYRDAILQYNSRIVGAVAPTKRWSLKGLMPLSISDPVFDEEDGDALTFTMTFAVQYIKDDIEGTSTDFSLSPTLSFY